nr:Protein Y57G7A.11 [Haemonchus contortus]
MLEDETSGWYRLEDGILVVWEGVCCLKLNGVIQLFKIRDGKLLDIKMPLDAEVKQVCSDGYWECAEVTGTLKRIPSMFYYHADNTKNARLMLQHLVELTSTTIQSLNIRLDPDPLRLLNSKQISNRISEWSQLGKQYCNDYRIVLDSNMPL